MTKVTEMRTRTGCSRPGRRAAAFPAMIGVAAALVASSCSRHEPVAASAEGQAAVQIAAVQAQVPALVGPQQLTIQLPDGAGLPGVALAASNSLRITDRVSMTSPDTGFVTAVNTGTVQTDVGTDTKLGNIISQSPVVIRDRSAVAGFVRSAGKVSLINGATIAGADVQNTPITPLQTFTWTVTIPPSTGDIDLEPDQTRAPLSPGSYGNVALKSRTALSLLPGTFFINSLDVEPQATLIVSSGPVFIYVGSSLIFHGTISAGTQDRSFFIGYLGTAMVSLETVFTGTIVAPHALLRFAPTNGGSFVGSFFAQDVDVEPGDTIALKTFTGWGTLFPVPDPRPVDIHPSLACVAQGGANDFRALFGYVNDSFQSLRVRVGTDNTFGTAPIGRGQVQRFLPGSVPAAFATRFGGASMTWTTPGGAVTASSLTQACPTTSCVPACGNGESCVGGACVTVCGDGLCAGDEGCGSCPADCGCAAGRTCIHNGCATPARCGLDWQCGAGTSFGVQVDCGSCPAGGTCVAHVCQ
jgi:hypothetical protein